MARVSATAARAIHALKGIHVLKIWGAPSDRRAPKGVGAPLCGGWPARSDHRRRAPSAIGAPPTIRAPRAAKIPPAFGIAHSVRALLVILAFLAAPAHAVEPDEILDDPALEARARVISRSLRCLVCRNQNIDNSNAALARDLRILVRERLVAGDSNDAAVAYIVARYGEFVLLTPRATGSTFVLWGAGPVMLLAGLGIGIVYLRRRRTAPPVAALTETEEARLRQILDD